MVALDTLPRMLKLCSGCGLFKDYDHDFAFADRRKGYKQSRCLECRNKTYDAWRRAHRVKIVRHWRKPATATHAHCPRCDRFRWKRQFHRNRARPDGLAIYCIDCNRIRRSEWRTAKSLRCECGWQKETADKACTRCMPYQGRPARERAFLQEVLECWFDNAPATSYVLAERTGYTVRTIWRIASDLVKAGLVKAGLDEQRRRTWTLMRTR